VANEGKLTVEPVIGLEVHVQLAARSKMWCGCPVEFGRSPNTATCPVCLGLPGALPVLNSAAVELAVLTGLALNCTIARRSRWERKHYFYPDQPKNYQITQYEQPLCSNGYMELKSDHRIHKIRIDRAHLEEDAGKIHHNKSNGAAVDLNRAGAPLLEIVTCPDFNSADEVREFAVQLQRLVRYLGVSEANMEKGQMRFEPNINLKITAGGREIRTPIVEVKNLNSFHSLHAAIVYEQDRQLEQWRATGAEARSGAKVSRGWDDDRRITLSQREKEEADDYRYFPDPDLGPLTTDPDWVAELREHLPELPIPRTERCISEYKLTPHDADAVVDCRATADLLDQAAEAGGDKIILAKQFLGFWARLARERNTTIAGLGITPRRLAELADLVRAGVVNATSAARIAGEMAPRVDELLAARASGRSFAAPDDSGDPDAAAPLMRPAPDKCIISFEPADSPELAPAHLAEQLGLLQTSNETEIMEWIELAFDENEQAVRNALGAAPKSRAARGYLIGQVMKASDGKAAPRLTAQLLEQKLKSIA